MRRCFSSRLCSNGCMSFNSAKLSYSRCANTSAGLSGKKARARGALARLPPRRCERSAPAARGTARDRSCPDRSRDLEMRFDRRFDRLRELLDIAQVGRERPICVGRLLVELSGEQQRLGAQLRNCRIRPPRARIPARSATAVRPCDRRARSAWSLRDAARVPDRSGGTRRARSPPWPSLPGV